MGQQPTAAPTGPPAVVDRARALLTELTETLWSAKTGAELVEALQQLERCRSQVAALEAAVVTEVDALPHDPAVRAEAERVLLEEAAKLDAIALAAVGKRVAEVVDHDRTERRLEAQLEQSARVQATTRARGATGLDKVTTQTRVRAGVLGPR